MSRMWTVVLAGLALLVAAIAVELVASRSKPPEPDDADRAALAEVQPMLQAKRFEDCAARLAGRVVTDAGRHTWLACAQHGAPGQLEAACAAWRGTSPRTVPSECDLDVAKLRALADAGKFRECAELARTLPDSVPVRMLLARCKGAISPP